MRQFAVIAFPHGSIQIDDVQPLVPLEFPQQRQRAKQIVWEFKLCVKKFPAIAS
jgi:hypothetical protein